MDVCAVQSVELSLDCGPDLNVQIKPISSSVDGGAQVQQIINVECRGVFFEPLLLDIKFQSVCSLYYTFACAMYTCFEMRDEKEERKKQARSNKQTRQSNTAHPRQSLFRAASGGTRTHDIIYIHVYICFYER